MKFISKMKMQTLALSLALALGLVLSVSTSPVYGSATSSIRAGGNITQATSLIDYLKKAATWGYHRIFGVASTTTSAAYPSDALDR
jgi:hypothetical protein